MRERQFYDEFSFSCMKKRFKMPYMYVFLWENVASGEGISDLRGRILAKGNSDETFMRNYFFPFDCIKSVL